MYMYNVLFNFDKTDGLFSETDDQAPGIPPIPRELRTSKNWLVWRETIPPVPFDVEADNWDDLGEATTLLLNPRDNPGDILIRVAPDRRGATFPSAAAKAQLVVSFGRPVKFKQKRASPFTHNQLPGGNVLTTFILDPLGPGIQRTTTRAWHLNLGSLVDYGVGKKQLVNRYEFSLGVVVTEPGTSPAPDVVRHYGEDPEMDVGD